MHTPYPHRHPSPFLLLLLLRVWDSNTQSTYATMELKPSLMALDWAPQTDHLVLVGSGNGIVQLYDCNTHRFHWSINSERQYPK